jgi:methyl-accepting chemotaxis protein
MLTRLVDRLRAARETLAQVEGGDLRVKVQDDEPDELGFLGVSVNRTTDAIAGIVGQVQQQSQDLAAMAQELAASAQELQAASQEISATAQQLSDGTTRQRELIGHGREDSEAAAGVAAQLHTRAQEAERQVSGVAQQAQRHGLGFRVVADEVRKLAEQSSRTADEVRARVRQTQDQVGELIAAMGEGRRTAEGVGVVSTAVRQALDAIFGDLNATVRFAGAFAGETEDQARRIREVVQRMEEVAGIAETAALGAEQASAATEEQIASLGELTTTSQHLSVAAAKLSETIQRFNVNGGSSPPTQ